MKCSYCSDCPVCGSNNAWNIYVLESYLKKCKEFINEYSDGELMRLNEELKNMKLGKPPSEGDEELT